MTTVRSVEKALMIMDYLEVNNNGIGVSELSRKLDLPKATTIRLLSTLHKCGYLEQNKETKKYQLGIKLFHLGTSVLEKMKLRPAVLPVMNEIWEQCGEAIYLNILSDYEVLCIDYIESIHSITGLVRIGQRSPIYAGASAKALLAFMPKEYVDQVINRTNLAPIGKNTITCPFKLKNELEKVKQQGYAISKEERVVGAWSLSVPIFETNNKVIASLSLLIPFTRWDDQHINNLIQLLISGSNIISERLGSRLKLQI